MPRVIISSGHTSDSPGTIANGLREVDVARQIARATLPFLRHNGIISLSVPPDLDLQKRIEWINKSGYSDENNDITLEIHCNDGGNTGVEAWYEGEGNNKSHKLSDAILSGIAAASGLKNLGSRSEFDHELGSLAFLHESLPIASLIECGFLDNESDAAFLKNSDNINKLGKGIAKGIISYFGLDFKEPPQVQAQTQTAKPAASTPQPVAPAAPAFPKPQPVSAFDDFPAPATAFPAAAPRPGGFPPAPMPGGAGSFTPMPSREERKDMISKAYIKILGREPNQNDLNYFLNIGISEDQLLKKMIDSQEHADLVKARQEVLKTKKQYNDQQTELARLRAQANDQQHILNTMQQSITEKNRALGEMQQRITSLQKINVSRSGEAKDASSKQSYKGNFVDKLFRAFSDLFE